MKKLYPLLPVLFLIYWGCENPLESRVEALENQLAEQETEQEQQQALIDSLMAEILNQQTVMGSLDASQQAYIDSLINLGNISDSLLQVYTDSLNTVQNAYIDSLHNAQQTLLGQIVSTNTGFTPTQVYSGDITTTWTDLDLSSVVGQNSSLVILEIDNWTCSACSSDRIYFRTNGDDFEPWTGDPGTTGVNSINMASFYTTQTNAMILITSDSNGIVEHRTFSEWTNNATISVVFYLNQ